MQTLGKTSECDKHTFINQCVSEVKGNAHASCETCLPKTDTRNMSRQKWKVTADWIIWKEYCKQYGTCFF